MSGRGFGRTLAARVGRAMGSFRHPRMCLRGLEPCFYVRGVGFCLNLVGFVWVRFPPERGATIALASFCQNLEKLGHSGTLWDILGHSLTPSPLVGEGRGER